MADAGYTSLDDYIAQRSMPTMPAVAPTGGGFAPLGSLMAGFSDLGAGVGRTGEAIGQVTGATGLRDAGRGFAAARDAGIAKETKGASEDFWTPSGFGNAIIRGLPTMGAALAGAGVGALVGGPVGAFAGGAAALFPGMVGGNVETAKRANKGQLSDRDAGMALALGVPEAAIGNLVPGQISKIARGAAEPIAGSLAKRIFMGGAELAPLQAAQGAVNTAMTQSFDPDMAPADRAQGIIDSFLQGGAQGFAFGGVTHGVAGKRGAAPAEPGLGGIERVARPGEMGTGEPGTGIVPGLSSPFEPGGLRRARPGDDMLVPDQEKGFGSRSLTPEAPQDLSQRFADPDGLIDPSMATALPKMPDLYGPRDPYGENRTSDVVDLRQGMEPRTPDIQGELPLPTGAQPAELRTMSRPGEPSLFDPQGKQPLREPVPITEGANGQRAVDIEKLIEQRDGIVAKGKKATTAEAQTLSAINDNLASRAKPGQDNAFFTADEMGARKPQIDAMREQMRAENGKSESAQRFADRLNAANEPELVQRVREEIDAHDAADKTLPKWLTNLANKYGITDETGATRDLTAERAELSKKIDTTWSRTNNGQNVGMVKKAQALQAQRGELDKLIALRDQADELSKPPTAAVEAEAPKPAETPVETRAEEKPYEFPDDLAEIFGGHDLDSPVGQALVAQAQKPELRAQDIARIKREVAKLPPRKAEPTPVPVAEKGFIDPTPDAPLADGTQPYWQQDATFKGGAIVDDLTETPAKIASRTPPSEQEPVRQNTTYKPLSQEERDAQYAQRKADVDARINAHAADETLPRVLRDRALEAQKMTGHAEREAVANAIDVARPRMEDAEPLPRAERPAPEAPVEAQREAPKAEEVPDEAPKADVTETPTGQQVPTPIIESLMTGKPSKTGTAMQSKAMKAAGEKMREREAKDAAKAEKKAAEVPAWAQEHTEGRRGTIVYSDADHALMRGFDVNGNPQYFPIDRQTGKIARAPVDTAKIGWLTDETRAKLQDKMEDFIDATDAAQAKAPNGPWTGKRAKVIGTDNVDPRLVNTLSGWMKQMGLGNVRVLLTHPDDLNAPDASAKYKMHGEYMSGQSIGMRGGMGEMGSFGPGKRDFVIHIKPDATDGVKVETLAHEMGHIIQRVSYKNAPKEIQDALVKAHADWYKSTRGMSASELIKSVRNREMSDALLGTNDGPLTRSEGAYFRSFNEWFADGVSRWATTNEKPLGVVNKFFATVADKMKKLVALVTGKPSTDFLPPEAISKFMDYVKTSDSGEAWVNDRKKTAPEMTDREQAVASLAPQEQNESLGRFAGQAAGITKYLWNKLVTDSGAGPTSLKDAARATAYGFFPRADLLTLAKKVLPSLDGLNEVHELKDAIKGRYAQLGANVAQTAIALPAAERATLNNLLRASEHGVDPRVPWAKQPAEVLNSENAPAIKSYVDDLNRQWDSFKQKGHADVYQRLVDASALEPLMRYAHALHTFAEGIPGIEALPKAPAELFLDNGLLHSDPKAARDAAQGWVDHYTQALSARNTEKVAAYSALDAKSADRAKLVAENAGLQSLLDDVNDGLAFMKKAPNFHLGRSGDFYVTTNMPVGLNGAVDPKAAGAVYEALRAAGYGDLSLNTIGNGKIYMRLDNADQQKIVAKTLEGLRDAGHIEGDVGLGLTNKQDSLASMAPIWMERLIERIKNDKSVNAEARDQRVEQLTRQWLDMLPDNSVKKVLTERKGVQGYDTDMLANFTRRSEMTGNALGNLTMSGRISEKMEGARGDLQSMKELGGSENQDKILQGERFLGELEQRERERTMRVSVPMIDKLRSMTHTWFLGFSPAYMLLQQSQVLMNLLPELGRTHGFLKSMKTISSTAPEAFRVMKATFMDPNTRVGGTINADTLRNAGISEKTIETVMQAVNRGKIDIGGYAREMTRTAQSPSSDGALIPRGADKFQRYALMTAYYAETVTRVQAALAARELGDAENHKISKKFDNVHDYVGHIIGESMFNWNAGNTPRQMGQHGLFGAGSKLIFAFTQYQTQMLTKMYRELHQAFSSEGTKEDRISAAKYLGGHLAATAVLGGALGLPGLTAGAAVADRVGNAITGRDDWDLAKEFREHLRQIFGDGASEAISRGLPRAFGVDLGKMGEEHLLPFSKFAIDKRRFDDKLTDWAKDALGAPASMVSGMIEGGIDFANGNYLKGITKLAPTALRNPLEATQMGLYGYLNSKNEQLPITAGARQIALKALGFTDANKAQYEDIAATKRNLDATMKERADRIKSNMAFWLEQGDQEAAQKWMDKGMVFDQQHPMHPIMPTMPDYMQTRAQDVATARGLGVPLGTKLKDFGMVPQFGMPK